MRICSQYGVGVLRQDRGWGVAVSGRGSKALEEHCEYWKVKRMQRCYTLKGMLHGTNRVLCYGTGNAAELFVRYCARNGIEIADFLVTQRNSTEESFHNKRVWQVNEYPRPFTIGIVVAVVFPQYAQEIIDNLRDENVKVLWLYDDKNYIHAIRAALRKQIRKRAKLSIFDIKQLAAPLYYEDIAGTGYLFYGIYKAVQKYTKHSQIQIKQCGISHGCSDSTMIEGYDKYLAERYGTLYVCGGEHIWRQRVPQSVNVHYLSPYIFYARSLLGYGKLQKMKRKLHRTLLVFPLHSVDEQEYTTYDVDVFIKQIEEVKKVHGYHSVMVCMYWYDIIMDKYKAYQNMGWKVVTAGHRLDANFLNRLRSIISLADMVVTNGVGTHIGYAICLRKPVYVIDLPSYNTAFDINGDKYGEEYAHKFVSEAEKTDREIKQAFCRYNEVITQEQIAVIEKYWGNWSRRTYIRTL